MLDIQTKLNPVPFTRVRIDDPFWMERSRTNREHTIPAIYDQCERSGRLEALKLQWREGEPKPHVFWDSDVTKWIEAASYSLALHPDAELEKRVDETIDLLASGQQPDGYLNIYFTAVEPGKRWMDLKDAHELYCAGHLFEAGVAHFEATGSRKLLDVVCKYADYIAQVFGSAEGQIQGYCGHPEIELALVRLYRCTNNRSYLDLSKYFVDERGRQPNYFDSEKEARGGTPAYFEHYFSAPGRQTTHDYSQSHKPVREQEQVVGHSVRAMYLYSAMADLAEEYNDPTLMDACKNLWNHLTETQMYITGGIGSSEGNEGFTDEYDLPNDTAYCETCASIGLVFWNHRMLHATGEAKYADVLERALYNGAISGVSLSGKSFFYVNPLESHGQHHRQEWFEVSCCPANLSRLLTTLGQYIYSEGEREAAVNLYVQSTGELAVNGEQVKLRQQTNYPWEGHVAVTLELGKSSEFALKLRRPGWCSRVEVSVNGEKQPASVEKGYIVLDRVWNNGDRVELEMEMVAERIYVNPAVAADRGRVAIQRGPVVYCLEEADNGPGLDKLSLSPEAPLNVKFDASLLEGVAVIRTMAQRPIEQDWAGKLYANKRGRSENIEVSAIPYYAWDNRQPGAMLVWIRESS
ncbi:Non-reducing end beta-L-arabinofuranosidase [Paenibacillus plantiphilus]|uniref:Non-reducing end beta-L-arabinofuranosidase n=1 Tax=Paenibacillus plantiphilus TaxID=2905650 RepID=A0ABN8GUP8_9BACL|nr:beta-L-arabinofuranosidase domain-containing protein [Paenibacillus plantiphilus]CAH1216278.1 Non-reducing end beta-L-arabinofuranosidase [Paenibacillus plantiphilus]